MNSSSHSTSKKANTFLGLQFISDFGDQITASLLALSILDITNSTGEVGFIYFISTLGYVIFTLAGGALGDNLSKGKLLFAADFGRAIVVLLMIIGLHSKSLWLIYCTSFLLSILGALHRPAKLSVWTESIPVKKLERYNSLSELSLQLSTALGPLIAGFLALRSLVNVGFTVDALTFLACAICFLILVKDRVRAPSPSLRKAGGFFQGIKAILHQQDLLRSVSFSALQMIGYGAFNATFLVLAQRDFGWTKTEYAIHLSITSIGAIIGALFGATHWAERISPNTKLVACSVLPALALSCIIQFKIFPLCSLLFAICTGFACLALAVTRTTVQITAKDRFPDCLSSIIATRSVIIKSAALLGTSTCLLLDDFLSLQSTLKLFVLPIGVSCLALFLGRRTVPVKQSYPG